MEGKKGLGIAAFVVSILGFCSWPIGLIALVLAIVALVKKSGKGFAIAAIIIACIGIIISLILGSIFNLFTSALDTKVLSGDDDITVTTDSGESSDWLSGWISEGIDELNNQIEEGVTEFSETVNDVNEQVVEGVEEGVENVNEGLEEIGEGVSEGIEEIGEAITGEEEAE